MKYDPDIHNRHSIRLEGYDYAQSGSYFVTICTQNHKCLFGTINNEQMILNIGGYMIKSWWYEIQNKFSNIELREFVIMPNHLHGIITINETVGADLCVCPNKSGEHVGSPLHRMIQWFKTMTTNQYIRLVKQNILPPFDKRLWQRNYYEHIIRNEPSYLEIARYIVENPLNWETDEYYK